MTRRKVLTEAQIKEIRKEHASKRGSGYASLGRKYGVGASTIRDHIKYWIGYSV